MLRSIGTVFRKIRIFTRAIRNGLWGVVCVIGLWIFAAPMSATEAAHIGVTRDAATQAEALRTHRIAKVLLLVATERTYGLIASRAGDGATADSVRLGIQIAALGRPINTALDGDTRQAQAPVDGAKFVTARTD